MRVIEGPRNVRWSDWHSHCCSHF